jgi:hypothetical protein
VLAEMDAIIDGDGTVSVVQAAKTLGISRATGYRRRKSGNLASVEEGGRYRVRVAHLRERRTVEERRAEARRLIEKCWAESPAWGSDAEIAELLNERQYPTLPGWSRWDALAMREATSRSTRR